jgi:hypothetical protein
MVAMAFPELRPSPVVAGHCAPAEIGAASAFHGETRVTGGRQSMCCQTCGPGRRTRRATRSGRGGRLHWLTVDAADGVRLRHGIDNAEGVSPQCRAKDRANAPTSSKPTAMETSRTDRSGSASMAIERSTRAGRASSRAAMRRRRLFEPGRRPPERVSAQRAPRGSARQSSTSSDDADPPGSMPPGGAAAGSDRPPS